MKGKKRRREKENKMMDLILDKINLRPKMEQPEGNVQSEHIQKVRTRYIQSIKLAITVRL